MQLTLSDYITYLLGIVSSIIAAAVYSFIVHYLIPKIKGIKNKDLSGIWVGFYGVSVEPSVEIKFKQLGNKLTGHSKVKYDSEGKPVKRKYLYKGIILGKSLVLTFDDLNNKGQLGGAMIFFISNSDGTRMTGKSIYYKPEINEVVTTDAVLWMKGHENKHTPENTVDVEESSLQKGRESFFTSFKRRLK